MQFEFKSFVIFAETKDEIYASELFSNELNKRINNNSQKTEVIFKTDVSSLPDNDSYSIEISDKIIFTAKTIRGFIFAYSHFLRKCEVKDNKIILIKDISGIYIPE